MKMAAFEYIPSDISPNAKSVLAPCNRASSQQGFCLHGRDSRTTDRYLVRYYRTASQASQFVITTFDRRLKLFVTVRFGLYNVDSVVVARVLGPVNASQVG